MKEFHLTVGGIQRKEYYEACRETGRRMRIILALSMVLICGLIILFTGNASLAAFLGPLAVYVIVVGGYELLPRLTYRDQLAVIDPPVEYTFSGTRWTVKKGDVTAELEWRTTPKIHRTKNCLFLYNDETTSNLLPLRLMTEGQRKSIETWFRNSRTQFKAYQKKQDRLAREKFKKEHPGLRLGRTGPAWGPFRRKK